MGFLYEMNQVKNARTTYRGSQERFVVLFQAVFLKLQYNTIYLVQELHYMYINANLFH